MTASSARVSGGDGWRYAVVIGVVAILALSLLVSINLSNGQLGVMAWSNFISGVQISTLLVVVALLLLWVRSRER